MGSYGMISIKGIELYGAKNSVYYHLLKIFSSTDYIERNYDEDGETITEKKFQTSCGIAKKRLDIIGYNMHVIEEEIERNMSYLKSEEEDYPSELFEMLYNFYDSFQDSPRYDLIDEISLMNINQAIINYFQCPTMRIPSGNLLLDYFITYHEDHYGLGIPVRDTLSEIRIILESLNEDDTIEYDLTEIINNGYADMKDILSIWDERQFDLISSETVILAEGTTDIFVLKKSLELLFPQYKHLYTFFDFDNIKSPGSTSNLVNLIKSFVNAGIKNRIIAIFDNDTAAYEALSTLDSNKITPNIKILHLPHLDWATKYPTLGPTGEVNTDINKLACSIELFMGKNILVKNNNFIPIQWTGYNQKLKRYQGEIVFKKEINELFRDIIKKIEEEGFHSVDHDWEQLKYLWESIFNAFAK